MGDRPDAAGADERNGAVFEPAPVRPGGRSRIPVALAVLAVSLTAVAGVLDRGLGQAAPPIADGRLMTTPIEIAAETPPSMRSDKTNSSARPEETPALMLLDVRPDGRHLFVHGDVFSLDALLVVVGLEARGERLETRTVDLPGGSTSFLTGANPRFDVRFDMPPDAAPGSHWVIATTYDTTGVPVASARAPVIDLVRQLAASR